MKIRRFEKNPIIVPEMDESMGSNINGPSLIKVPDWVEAPLGRYYLYFAHHQGEYIRLAYADDLAGPWKTHPRGVMRLDETGYRGHVASPDVHVDEAERRFRMYFHGCIEHGQRTSVALSTDGLAFQPKAEILGNSYFRVFFWRGYHYALVMPGEFRRSRDGITGFEPGPTLFTEHMRHCALRLRGNTLEVFFSNAYDRPERILCSTIDISGDWMDWQAAEPVTVLEPETDYEGADLPLEPSKRGSVHVRARQLRDPCIYEENGRTYLLHTVAGEHGIAIAEIID